MKTRRDFLGVLALGVANLLGLARGPMLTAAVPPSTLAAWPRSHPMVFWLRTDTAFTGAVQDVFIGDTRFGAPRSYSAAIAYTNLWTLRAEWERDPAVLSRPNFFHLEKPETREASSAGYQCNLAFGKAWLKRGGNLYVIIENEAKGEGLARDLDSAKTWVLLRK